MVKEDFVFKLGQTRPGEWHLWEVSLKTGQGHPVFALPQFMNETVAKMSDYDRKDYAQFLANLVSGAFEKGKEIGRAEVQAQLRALLGV
ncbi:MAG: hypothetical protein LPK02_07140 [Rhodobacterales bacterium]|nr:hypothetical protein [Rhodobacterales bacterium]